MTSEDKEKLYISGFVVKLKQGVYYPYCISYTTTSISPSTIGLSVIHSIDWVHCTPALLRNKHMQPNSSPLNNQLAIVVRSWEWSKVQGHGVRSAFKSEGCIKALNCREGGISSSRITDKSTYIPAHQSRAPIKIKICIRLVKTINYFSILVMEREMNSN